MEKRQAASSPALEEKEKRGEIVYAYSIFQEKS